MTSTNSNIWKRFLFNNQHTIYNKDIIEYHIQYNKNENKEEQNTNEEEQNTNEENIEQVIIHHLDMIIIYCLLGLFCIRKYF